ncbi:MAG TPA: DUF1816 domain-containing protein [Xenococcaceae cyanobacterium]
MKEILINLLNSLGLAYWVKIDTNQPPCTYYFGPFLSLTAAKDAKAGYIEDLKSEGCASIDVEIKRCKPSELTVFSEEVEEPVDFKAVPAFSSQS